MLAFGTTLAANLVLVLLRASDLCRIGPGVIPLSMLGAVVAFLVLAASAGFATGLASEVQMEPVLAGVLVGALSGCALVALFAFGSPVSQRLQQLATICPATGGISIGQTPPPGLLPTPPPGAFATPPGAQSFGPPTGPAGFALSLFGLGISIALGIGLAAGIAYIAGMAGRSLRAGR